MRILLRTSTLLASALFGLSAFASVPAPDSASVEAWLRRWDANPLAASNALPERSGSESLRRFSAESVANGDFIEAKDAFRAVNILSSEEAPLRAPIQGNDDPTLVSDNAAAFVRKLADMEPYAQAKLGESPWSDTYWPMYVGLLGFRYADKKFPSDDRFAANYKYGMKKKPAWKLNLRDAKVVDMLSPSEKYDLLVGDPNFTLTQLSWAEGKYYQDRDKKVETWMGICHGWAPASYMLGRPTKAISAQAVDGRWIPFYPSDMKALASLLWANAAPTVGFVGGRCNDKHPKTDRNGRVLDPDCFDTNPGSFHLALVNQLGISQRSLIMDATFDYEIWNQPLYSYAYTYFNPITRKAGSLADSTIAAAAYAQDPFRAYRSPEGQSVVGIALNVTYTQEVMPGHYSTDAPKYDALKTVTYYYDLELNAAGEIIGGEWYQKAHPDFLWNPAKGAAAKTAYDDAVQSAWPGNALPKDWAAQGRAAAGRKTPLAHIVEELIRRSRK